MHHVISQQGSLYLDRPFGRLPFGVEVDVLDGAKIVKWISGGIGSPRYSRTPPLHISPG